MPEITFETLDAVPEGLRESAKEVNGKVVIDVVPNAKLKEFRDNNIALSQERDTLATQLTGYKAIVGDKPEDFAKQFESLQTIARRVKDGELIENTSLDEALAKRTAELKANLEGQVNAVAQDRDAWKQKAVEHETKYKRTLIDRAITDAVLDPKSGARPEALPDLLQRAYGTFRVNEQGNVVPFDDQGQVMYGGDGSKPMSGVEWLKKLSEQAPYFFKSSSGGGAGGTGAPAGGNGKFTPEQIAKMSPDEYKKHRQAGNI